MRRRLTVFLTFLGGLYFFIEFIFPTTVPLQVPRINRYNQVLSEKGKPTPDGIFLFDTAVDLKNAVGDIDAGVDIAFPNDVEGGDVGLRWYKKGRMFAENGFVYYRPADGRTPADRDEVLEPAIWTRSYPSTKGPDGFGRACLEHGGEKVGYMDGIVERFRFAEFSQAITAMSAMGVEVVPPEGTLTRPAELELGRRSEIFVRVARLAEDSPESFYRYRPSPAYLVSQQATHRYFVFNAFQDEIVVAFICVSALAIGLGIINVLRSHGVNMLFMRRGWGFSATLVLSMVLTMVVMGIDWRNNIAAENARKYEMGIVGDMYARALGEWEKSGRVDAEPKRADFALTEEQADRKNEIMPGRLANDVSLIYTNVIMGIGGLFVSLGSAMFSLLAVYIAAAAYRAFRVKSGEAALMMIFAVLVMIGQTPIASILVDPILHLCRIEHGVTAIRSWVLVYVNTPAFRAIEIGAAIAGLAMGFRVWLSMERGAFSRD